MATMLGTLGWNVLVEPGITLFAPITTSLGRKRVGSSVVTFPYFFYTETFFLYGREKLKLLAICQWSKPIICFQLFIFDLVLYFARKV